MNDFEISAADEGEAIRRANAYRASRPKRRIKAAMKPVPAHLKKKKSTPIAKNKPAIPEVKVPNWLSQYLRES